MRLKRSYVLALIATYFALPFASAQQSVSDVVKRNSDAVVLIVVSDSTGQETALGSGFLVSSDGQIVTNYHVIKDARSAVIKLTNGAFFPVSGVLASDPDRDLAVIKVKGKNLPYLTLSEGRNVNVGDHVVAIGSPLGLEGTVSDGIVSAVREFGKKAWIQTTAPASHGNSGGPLVSMDSKVVGVITLGVSPELGQNLNFAVPVDEVSKILLIAGKEAKPLQPNINADNANVQTDIWTSLTSGRDFRLVRDGDYIYADLIGFSSELKSAGAFVRSEVKKSADGKWKGLQGDCRKRYLSKLTSGDFRREISLLLIAGF